jgi:hypothetical protein
MDEDLKKKILEIGEIVKQLPEKRARKGIRAPAARPLRAVGPDASITPGAPS